MGYAPYDPSPKSYQSNQYQQSQYQSQYQYQQYPYHYGYRGPPKSGFNFIIIIAVIVGIIIAALAAACALPMYLSGQDSAMNTTAYVRAEEFVHPFNGQPNSTVNMGGWKCNVNSVSGPRVSLNKVSIKIKVRDGNLDSSSISLKEISHVTNSNNIGYYIHVSESTTRFMDGGKTKEMTTVTVADLDTGELPTVEGVVFIYVDMDNNERISEGDYIYIYRDVNGDGAHEIGYAYVYLYGPENTIDYVKIR